MAKEQKENVVLTENEVKSQAAPAKQRDRQETKYRVEELVEAAKALFHVRPLVAKVALKAKGRDEYTKEEAAKIVAAFMKKEVK